MQYIKDLFGHNFKTSDKIMTAIRTVDKGKFIEEKISGKGSLRDVVVHIFGAEDFWINGVILKKVYAHYKSHNFTELDQIEAAWRNTRDDIEGLLGQLTPDKLSESRTVKWEKEYNFTTEKILQHVYTHTVHHVGQVVAGIRILGGDAPQVDII